MNVAVTGGNGVVGRPIVETLVDQGHRVTALARSGDSARILGDIGAGTIEGDILDPQSLRPLMAGADWVFHLAGVNEMCSREPEIMEKVNVEGTTNVILAARAAGVGRLIHTSSAAAIGESQGTVGTETSPHRGRYLSRYERSKHLAEQALAETAEDLDYVVVNPSSVQGPGRSSGTGKLFLDLLNGRLPFLIETEVSIVDIDDCARGHLLAAERGESRRRYILSGASLSMTEAMTLLEQVTGRILRPRFLPGWLATAGGAFAELGARVVGRRPKVCREMVRVLRAGHIYDGSRATRELGLEYTLLEDTIRRTVDWFEREGLLA